MFPSSMYLLAQTTQSKQRDEELRRAAARRHDIGSPRHRRKLRRH